MAGVREDEGKLAPVETRMTSQQLEQFEELGRRAVACKRWRWMPGMLGLSNKSSSRSIWIRIVDPPRDDASECWPDFSDPATLGCLLALVRQEWGPCVNITPTAGWVLQGARLPAGGTINLGIVGTTEAEALVKALEVAP